MTKKYLGLAAGLLLLAGCSNNDFIDEGTTAPEGQMRTISTINATMGNADTRVQLLNNHKMAWEDDDQILVFSDTSDGAYVYSMSYLSDPQEAVFSGREVTGTEFYSIYPAGTWDDDFDSSKNEVSIPWNYYAVYDGTDVDYTIPMFAKSSGNNMLFKQLGGLLHFQIYGEGILNWVELAANNEDLTDADNHLFCEAYSLDYTANEIKLEPYTDSFVSYIQEIISPYSDGRARTLSSSEPFDIYFSLPAGIEMKHGIRLRVGYTVVDSETLEEHQLEYVMKSEKSFTVTRAEMANFPAISTTGILPTPEPEKGWISNFFDLSGTQVGTYFYVFNDKVDWSFAFLLDGESESVPQDVIIIEFFTDYEGGTPALSWLEGAEVHDLMASRLHGPDGNIYRIGDSDGFKVKKNTDGTWYLSIENAKIHPNGSSTNIMEDFYLKFRGNFVGEEPEPTESLIGDDGVINTALLPNGYGGYQYDMWHFNLTDDEKYTVSFLRYPELEEDTSAIPTGTGSYDFYVTDNGKRYRAGYVPVTIVKNGDGTYTISVTDVYLNGEDGEPDVSGVSMTWTGTLNSYDESNGGGTLTIGGENISATYSEAVFSEDGWHLYFTNFQFPSSISADIKEYVENIARMTIVLTGEVGATEYPTVPSYNGDEFAFQIVDTNGNLLWYSMSEGETENSLQIHEDDDYIIRMSGNAKSVDGLKTSTVFFDWTGAIPRRH